MTRQELEWTVPNRDRPRGCLVLLPTRVSGPEAPPRRCQAPGAPVRASVCPASSEEKALGVPLRTRGHPACSHDQPSGRVTQLRPVR